MVELIALLRGVNVGKANRIAMADLRTLLTDLGFQEPRTLLNSGNATFTATATQARTAARRIEENLAERGVRSSVILRDAATLRDAMAADPFTDIATDGSRHFIGFLASSPSQAALDTTHALDDGTDRIRVIGAHAYLWLPSGLIESPVTKAGWDKNIGTAVTVRNMNTVRKLEQMLHR